MFAIHPGLDSTFALLKAAGNPEKNLRFIHIAGTNGKGSTGAMLEAAFRNAGLRTGFYSSPHLIDVRERFRINGIMPDPELFEHSIKVLAELTAGQRCSYFEFTTVLAAKIFAEAECDIVIWETGMGGRLDATNTVIPVASVITNIALDHEKYLGKTIAAIAKEKAGIIKEKVPVFIGFMPDEAREVIADQAKEKHCELFCANGTTPEMLEFDLKSRTQMFALPDGTIVKLSLPGKMQRRNAVTVVNILKYFASQGVIDLSKALAGLAKTIWPARMQFVSDQLIIDGGHNPDGVTAFTEALAEIFPGEKFTLIYGAFEDKAVENCLNIWKAFAGEVVAVKLTPVSRPSVTPEKLAAMFHAIAPDITVHPATDVRQAINLAEKITGKRRVVISGSLYLAGEALEYLYGKNGAGNLV